MPLITPTTYHPPFGFAGGKRQSIFPALFRKVPCVTLRRERLETDDKDFIDLDWSHSSNRNVLAIIAHGLEGSSRGPYVQGMARALQSVGIDALAWNFRGCSGEPNRTLKSYHGGSSDDLQRVLDHVLQTTDYTNLFLIGFSLGGNVVLKWLGEQGASLDQRIKGAVGISVAIDLASSATLLETVENRIFMRRFMKTLRAKVRQKVTQFPSQISADGLENIKTFRQFDDTYTAPIHGFKNVDDYWNRSSSASLLQHIRVPSLIINAEDDPFLGHQCYPIELAQKSQHLYLDMPKHGGHVGFIQFGKQNNYWSEFRTIQFLNSLIVS